MTIEYAVCWGDFDYTTDYGCYATFASREAALDYAADVVFERAAWRETQPLDPGDWVTVLTRDQVRACLADTGNFPLVDEFTEFSDGTRSPEEYVSICVMEVGHYER